MGKGRTNPTVYLAGGITGLTYEEATKWRETARLELAKWNITCFSPMRGVQTAHNTLLINGTRIDKETEDRDINNRD